MPQPAQHADAPIVVMGVQGSGKTTIGALLAVALDRTFVDGDTLHSPVNRAKMAAGTPLTDEDRRPWLDEVGRVLGSGPLVVGCSALRRRYRDQLRSHAPDAAMVHGHGTTELLRARVGVRVHEYMPPTLLDSQLATLEPLGEDEVGLVVDIAETPQEIVTRVLAWLGRPDAPPRPGHG